MKPDLLSRLLFPALDIASMEERGRPYNSVAAMAVLRRSFVGASALWAAMLPLAPFAASQPAPAGAWYALAFLIYGAGSVVCHQLPDRSFHLWAAQLPVCARCAGIYVGAAIAAIAMVRRLPDATHDRVSPRWLLAIAAVPTVVTLIYEWTTGDTPSNVIRALSGGPLGAAVALVVRTALR